MTSPHERNQNPEATRDELHAPFKLVEGIANQGGHTYVKPSTSEGTLNGLDVTDEIPSILLLNLTGKEIENLAPEAAAALMIERDDTMAIKYSRECYLKTNQGPDHQPAEAFFEVRGSGDTVRTYSINADRTEEDEDGIPEMFSTYAIDTSREKITDSGLGSETGKVNEDLLGATVMSVVSDFSKSADDEMIPIVDPRTLSESLSSDQANALGSILNAYTFNRIVGNQ